MAKGKTSFERILNNFDITLDEETEARYLCLIEGLEFIDKKLESLGLEDEALESARVSNRVHKALTAYINERFAAMLHDLRIENSRKRKDNNDDKASD